jgi:hypothetical protein
MLSIDGIKTCKIFSKSNNLDLIKGYHKKRTGQYSARRNRNKCCTFLLL